MNLATEDGMEKDLATLDDSIEDFDLDAVDLNVPVEYELRVAAGTRIARVREVLQLRWDMAANRVPNPDKYKELNKEYNWRLWEIAYLDKHFPGAKVISQELMELQARSEADDQKERVRHLQRA